MGPLEEVTQAIGIGIGMSQVRFTQVPATVVVEVLLTIEKSIVVVIVVTGISEPILIGVFLPRIGQIWTIVRRIYASVIVVIDVAQVSDAIAVGVTSCIILLTGTWICIV